MKKEVYEPGEWVLIGSTQNRAFVMKSDEWQTEVVVTSFSHGKPIPVKFHQDTNNKTQIIPLQVRTDSIVVAPELPRIYAYDELVVAYMTEDKEWYYDILALKEVEMDG